MIYPVDSAIQRLNNWPQVVYCIITSLFNVIPVLCCKFQGQTKGGGGEGRKEDNNHKPFFPPFSFN